MEDVQQESALAVEKKTELPEWEHVAGRRYEKTATAKGSSRISYKLDAIMPPHRRYLGMRRTLFLCVVMAIVLSVLALIIGLAVGLTKENHEALALPSNSQTFSGDLTYYVPGLGACGETSTASDHIVAVSHILFDAAGSSSEDGGNSNNNPLCNRILRATRYDTAVGTQRSVDLKVVDRCTGCAQYDIDTTLDAFDLMASEAQGRVNVTWAWLPAN